MVQYFISLVDINYITSENSAINSNKVKGITFNVSEKLGETFVPVEFLMDVNFELVVNNVQLQIGNDWVLSENSSNGNYKIIFNSEKELNKGDYLIVSVNRVSSISNKLFVDFDALTNNLGEYTIENYKITIPGTYYFVLDNADGSKINKRSEYSYTFVEE